MIRALALAAAVVALPAEGRCPGTLEGLVTCNRNEMPRSGSNAFVTPSVVERDAWRAATRQMLAGDCDETTIAERRLFTDSENGKTYYVMLDIARGWGAFIVDSNAQREIKATNSRTYIVAGSRRLADSGASACQSGRFLHIEQDPGFRAPADWIAAINQTFPPEPARRRRITKRAP